MTFEEFIASKEQLAARDIQKSSIYDLLEEHGEIPLELKETLEKIYDTELLRKYLKTAAKVDSIETFMDIISSDARK